MSAENRNLAGSIIQTDNGSFWYCCGNWNPEGVSDSLPAILAYTPDTGKYPKIEGQKVLEFGKHRFLKAFGTPFQIYKGNYLPEMGNVIDATTLGRVAFVSRRHITDIRDPHSFTAKYLEKLPEVREKLRRLTRFLDLDLEDLGITGSSLMMPEPTLRQETDLGIYGSDKSRKAYRILEDARSRGEIKRWVDRYYLPFEFEGTAFDPQFSYGHTEAHPFEGVSFGKPVERPNTEVLIGESPDAIFYPAVYTTKSMRLVTFRPGQRGYFKQGDQVAFESISEVDVKWSNGNTERVYAVLNDETGSVKE